jgi:hypothetical protein
MSAQYTIADAVSRVPGEANRALRILFIGLLLVGIVVFALTVAVNPERAWSAMLLNLTYWLPMAQGGVLLAAVFIIVKARWGLPMHRIVLGSGAFLPWGFLLLMVTLILGNSYLFPWVENPNPHRAPYLNLPFLYARHFVLIGALTLLSLVFMRMIQRLDAGFGKGSAPGKLKGVWEKWSAKWKGDEAEWNTARPKLAKLAAVIIVLYPVAYSFMAWDLVMSLDPHWYTTMLSAWFFTGGILLGFASLSVLSMIVRRAYRLGEYLTPKTYHDQGKLLFAFSTFWAYLIWSMFLPIWYANMPEETDWVVLRLQDPYIAWVLAALAFTWLLPFAGLMNMWTKKQLGFHMFFAVSVLVGMWLERLTITYPALYRPDLPVGLPEIGLTLGFLGLFGLCYQSYAAKRPLVPLPQLGEMGQGHH